MCCTLQRGGQWSRRGEDRKWTGRWTSEHRWEDLLYMSKFCASSIKGCLLFHFNHSIYWFLVFSPHFPQIQASPVSPLCLYRALSEVLGPWCVIQKNNGSIWQRASRTKPPHRTATSIVSSARTSCLRSAAWLSTRSDTRESSDCHYTAL